MSKHIGIYPGTFDPVHKGHVAFGIKAIELCNLDRLLILPEKKPRFKTDVTDISDRIRMLEIATKEIDKVEVITLDSSPFTVKHTLAELNHYLGNDALYDGSITLLVGADVLHTMPLWADIQQLLSTVSLAIGIRSGLPAEVVNSDLQNIEQIAKLSVNAEIIKTNYVHVSSSHSRVKGNTWTDDLDPAVSEYIAKRKLYE